MRTGALALAAVVLVAGCARFDDSMSAPFTPVPDAGSAGGGGGGQSAAPSAPSSSSARPAPTGPTPPPGPCTDPDPAVVATCLDATVAATGVPGGDSALVAEPGGRVLTVASGAPQTEFLRIDPGGGRVVSLAVSPRYQQDHLVFALVAGDGNARVVRSTPGDATKPVVDVPSGTAGGLAFVDGSMVVGIGGEVLRFPGFTGVGVAPAPESMARDLGRVTGLCTRQTQVFAVVETDRGAAVRRIDRPQPVWTWPDQRRAGGCTAGADAITVALPDAQRADSVPMVEGAVRGRPTPLAEKKYGRLTGLALVSGTTLLATTTNKDGGAPGRTDDRAVVLPAGGGGGSDRD